MIHQRSIFVGDVCVGSGVFLGRVDNDCQTNVVLLTARHVVTCNRNYSELLDLAVSGESPRLRERMFAERKLKELL